MSELVSECVQFILQSLSINMSLGELKYAAHVKKNVSKREENVQYEMIILHNGNMLRKGIKIIGLAHNSTVGVHF